MKHLNILIPKNFSVNTRKVTFTDQLSKKVQLLKREYYIFKLKLVKNPILYFCTNHATHPVQCFLFIHMIPLSFSLSPLTSLGVPRFSFISFSSFPFPLPPSLHLPPYFLRSPPLIHKYIKSMSFFYSLEYLKRPIFCYHKVTQGSPLCDFMVTGKIEPSSYIPTSM